jgi:hypothetical protein
MDDAQFQFRAAVLKALDRIGEATEACAAAAFGAESELSSIRSDVPDLNDNVRSLADTFSDSAADE